MASVADAVRTRVEPDNSDRAGRGRWIALGVLGLAVLLVNMAVTVLNVALPTMATDLGASSSEVQWMPAAFTLTMSGMMLLAGSLGDRWGHRRTLIGGIAVFGLASLVGAWASSPAMVIGAEALMGVGASVIMPLTLGLIRTLFPPEEQGRAIGVWTATVAFGMPLGPIIGGALLEHFWWGSIFLLNVVAAAIAVPLCLIVLPASRAANRRKPLDFPGALLSIAGVSAVVYGLNRAGTDGWISVATLAPIGLGALLLAGFVRREQRTAHPMADLTLFRMSAFTRPLIVLLLVTFAMLSLNFVAPQYLQGVAGHGPMEVGVRLLPLAATVLVGSLAGPRAVERVGARWVSAVGLLLLAAGLALLAQIGPSSGEGLFASGLALGGLGVGLTMPAAMAAATATLPREAAGSGAGLLNAMRTLGGAFGVSVVGSAISSLYRGRLGDGYPQPVRDSVVKASAMARSLGGEKGDALRHTAHHAYTHGMGLTLLICAAVTLLSAVFAAALMPGPASRRPSD